MEKYVRNKITELRLQKGVSEYQMSYDLGHSRGYVNNISSGKSLPSLSEFFSICDYFQITPAQFFDTGNNNTLLVSKALDELKTLDDNDILLVLTLLKRLNSKLPD
ncbi:helix-turn-helix transcriptional regulator [Eubacterium ventriosum]|jgi:transcriptional regulator with XRE-family HTH domain